MATTSEASLLHRTGHVMRFSFISVGLLAMLGFSACGVGVDDPEGQQAATGTSAQTGATGQNQQTLVSGPEGCPSGGGAVTSDIPTAQGEGPVNPSISALPSDPVPWKRPTDDNQVPGTNGMRPPPPPYGGFR